MSEESKTLQALLNGLVRHDYLGDSDMTDVFLKAELYPNVEDAVYSQMIHKARGLIKVVFVYCMCLCLCVGVCVHILTQSQHRPLWLWAAAVTWPWAVITI